LKTALTRLPVTSGIVLTAAALYASTACRPLFDPGVSPHFRYPGAITVLQMSMFPEVHGHFDLWDGRFWRLLVNAMHHAGPGHLLLNCLSLWILGDLLEPAIGRLRYLLFFLTAGYLSILAQSLAGDIPIGMSGAVYAVFGYLVVLRKHDRHIADRMPQILVTMGFSCLIVFVPLTAVGLIPVANLAHFAGLAYGWALAWLTCSVRPRNRGLAWLGRIAIHTAIAGLTLTAMQPFWNGRYHAWRAWQETQPEHRLRLWRQATALTPDIAVAWLGQAETLYQQDQKTAAWQTALKGLQINRSDEELDQFVRNQWLDWHSDPIRCQQALEELRGIFERESDAWIDRLDLKFVPATQAPIDIQKLLTQLKTARDEPSFNVELEVPQHVSGITRPHRPPMNTGAVDPDAPGSAVLGETL